MTSVTPNPRTGPLAKENSSSGRQHGGDVAVGDRRPGLRVALAQRPDDAARVPRGLLLAGPLEHQHVRVDREAGRQQQPGEPGQREGGAEGDERAVGDQPVGRQPDGGQQPDQPVDQHEEQRRQPDAEHGGPAAGVDGLGPEGRADHPLLDHLDGQRQRPALHERGEVLRLLPGEVAGDDGAARQADPALHGRVDLRGADHLLVEHDRHPAARVARRLAGGRAGDLLPGPPAVALEGQVDRPGRAELRVQGRAGRADALAGQRRRAEPQRRAAALVGQHALACWCRRCRSRSRGCPARPRRAPGGRSAARCAR